MTYYAVSCGLGDGVDFGIQRIPTAGVMGESLYLDCGEGVLY